MSEVNGNHDRITYSESRTINIGNYENISCFLSLGADVKSINFRDKTAKISATDSEVLNDQSGEAFKSAVTTIVNRVKGVLDVREVQIRKASAAYNDIGFDSLEKMPILPKKEKK